MCNHALRSNRCLLLSKVLSTIGNFSRNLSTIELFTALTGRLGTIWYQVVPKKIGPNSVKSLDLKVLRIRTNRNLAFSS